jgi:hypothetical protein
MIPHGNMRKMIVKTFEASVTAFQRHAAVAAELRSMGWVLVAYR